MSVTTMLTRNAARLLLPADRFFTRVAVSGRTGCPVFLTFDDGPHEQYTPQVLDNLAVIGAKATFFVLGTNLGNQATLVRRILNEGHSIGSHGWAHVRATEVTAASWLADADHGIAALEYVTGEKCCLFRPAYGDLTPFTISGLLKRQVQTVLWSQDVRDYLASSRDELSNWFRHNRPSPGSIVLMHDNSQATGMYLRDSLDHWAGDVSFDALPVPGQTGE